MLSNYTRPPYPELPPHFQTENMLKWIRYAHKHGLSSAYIAELMRIAEEPIIEILKGCNSTGSKKARMSSKELRKFNVALQELMFSIRVARLSINYIIRDEEVVIDDDYAPIGSHNERGISSPPGTTLSSIADFFSSKKTRKLLLGPIIADMQEEYFDALMADRTWKARWVRIRGCYAFWQAWGLSGVLKTGSIVWKILAG